MNRVQDTTNCFYFLGPFVGNIDTFALMSHSEITLPFATSDLWNLPSSDFLEKAKLLSAFQAQNNPVYKQWIELTKRTDQHFDAIHQIPFLPISFFNSFCFFLVLERASNKSSKSTGTIPFGFFKNL